MPGMFITRQEKLMQLYRLEQLVYMGNEIMLYVVGEIILCYQ